MSKRTYKTKGSLKGSWIWGVLIFCILLVVDLLTKAVADAYFSRPDAPSKIVIIPGWINLCITYNRGISYGMGNGAPTLAKLGVIAATAVLMIVLSVVYFKLDKNRTFIRIAIVFIVAGGVGNLIDRVYYQVWDPATFPAGVRDMVDLSRLGFAVCNFADFFITGGAVALVAALLFFDKEAVFPVGKYKQMAKEAEAKENAKKAEKEAKK